MIELLSDPNTYISLLTLTVLEIVLGVDNLVFISILAGKLPTVERARARKLGLGLALLSRIVLLCFIGWVVGLTQPIFTVSGHAISARDLVLILGGLFLLAKSTHEIHGGLEGEADHESGTGNPSVKASFTAIVVQIGLLDIVFSLDSVITAAGMVKQVPVMVAAVVLAMIFMLLFVGRIGGFIEKHPSLKMLALSFLILIGVLLIAEGFHHEIPKGYVYFAMAFSVGVEALNIRMRSKRAGKAVELRKPVR